jgi:glycosyltransferase involved in cell wall biosynthesis
VYHGLPPEIFPFEPRPGTYLAFVGRISPEKRPDLAVEIAEKAGMELRIAAKVSDTDRAYFEQEIRPLLSRPHVRFLGEQDHAGKAALMAGAAALLMPLDWPEPFGLVMIEAMACGTPVIAFRRGSVPEVVDEGKTGFIVDDADQAAAAVAALGRLDRKEVRRWFESRFSARRMAEDYLRVYRRRIEAMDGGVPSRGRLAGGPPQPAEPPGTGNGRHPGD